MASSAATSSVGDEMRQLFMREEFESVLIRTDNLQKRKRLGDESTKQFIQVLRALSLIQLGRPGEASLTLANVVSELESGPLLDTAHYAKLYAAWATNEGVEAALTEASQLQRADKDIQRLRAQLLYRCGKYAHAAELYDSLFRDAQATLEKKKRPAVKSSRWRLISSATTNPTPTVTAAELERLEDSACELGTNAMAALVLADRSADAEKIKSLLPSRYEIEYNLACADISRSRFQRAQVGLQHAEALVRSRVDLDDEDELEEALVPVIVQKAYLQQLGGEVAHAKHVYDDVMAEGRADAASLAVAANNLTVALGQLAFGKQDVTSSLKDKDSDNKQKALAPTSQQLLPREQHEALVEGLKKMRATAGKSVERKLTVSQRRAMAHNRAILLVQMGRMDACRTELARLKSEFPGDTVVPLIEASLIARQSGLQTADKVLKMSGDSNGVRAARVQLAVALGEREQAAQFLQSLFPDEPAAIVTAAVLLESIGQVDASISLLRQLVETQNDVKRRTAAQQALAESLLRLERYEEAAVVLREVVKSRENSFSGDENNTDRTVAIAKLVVATSYLDAEEAESQATKIIPKVDTKHVDVIALEGLPPPKRKQVAAMKGADGNIPSSLRDSSTADSQQQNDAEARATAARERKKKKKKKRLPKDYDPNGPPPDPERWLPKTLRSGYKKKKARNENNFKGSQGADAAAAEAAASKNAERSAAKAAAAPIETGAGSGGRPRAARKKNKRR